MQYETLKAILKKNGASLTRTRRLVFDLLAAQGPQSIQNLVNLADGQIDRATIYRTVELFEKLGIINRLNIGWKYKVELSDVFSGHHHHLHCSKCGKILDLPHNTMLETMIDTIALKADFSSRSHVLEIYGLCKNCKK